MKLRAFEKPCFIVSNAFPILLLANSFDILAIQRQNSDKAGDACPINISPSPDIADPIDLAAPTKELSIISCAFSAADCVRSIPFATSSNLEGDIAHNSLTSLMASANPRLDNIFSLSCLVLPLKVSTMFLKLSL